MWPSLLLLLIVSLSALSARPAFAQDARKSPLARSLFEEGVALGDRGDWVGAADRFARAYSLKPTSAVAFNWGSALVELHHFVEARELFASVQRDPTANAELKRECAQRLDTLSSRLAHVRVRVPVAGEQLTVELDQRPLPREAWDVPSPVDPGTHTIVLREEGAERAREQVTLGEGELRDVTLSPTLALAPEDRAPLAEPAPLAPSDKPVGKPLYKNWKLWTAVGAAAAVGVVVAIVVVAKHGNDAEPARGNAMPGVIRW